MNPIFKYILPFFVAIPLMFACSSDDDVRLPENILGVWSPYNDTLYLEFCEQNEIHRLNIEFQDDESIGIWTKDVYYYEPGYNLVVYLSGEKAADVFQIVKLTDSELEWCWVDKVEVTSAQSVGKILGDIIKKAQEGYKLDPALYQSFRRIPENQFFSILESLNIFYPWI